MHLSRRYFDLALHTDAHAWAPVKLAIAFLELEWWLHRHGLHLGTRWLPGRNQFRQWQWRTVFEILEADVEEWGKAHALVVSALALAFVVAVWQCRRAVW